MNNEQNRRFCPNCGFELPQNVAFCPNCGQKVPAAAPAQTANPAAPAAQEPKPAQNDPISQFNAQNTPPHMQQTPNPYSQASQPAQPQYQQPQYQQQYQQTTQQPSVAYAAPRPSYSAPQAPAMALGNAEPLTVGGFIGTMIVTMIPIIGFIMLLVWSFGSGTNQNRKNFCRAMLILGLIAVALAIIGSILGATAFAGIMNSIGNSL